MTIILIENSIDINRLSLADPIVYSIL